MPFSARRPPNRPPPCSDILAVHRGMETRTCTVRHAGNSSVLCITSKNICWGSSTSRPSQVTTRLCSGMPRGKGRPRLHPQPITTSLFTFNARWVVLPGNGHEQDPAAVPSPIPPGAAGPPGAFAHFAPAPCLLSIPRAWWQCPPPGTLSLQCSVSVTMALAPSLHPGLA